MADLLADIEAPVSNKSLVTYAVNGLGNKFAYVARIIHHRDPFPAFDTARSMLLIEESTLNRETNANSLGSSSSPLILVATTEGNSQGLCRNFIRRSFRSGDRCRFVHGNKPTRDGTKSHTHANSNAKSLNGNNGNHRKFRNIECPSGSTEILSPSPYITVKATTSAQSTFTSAAAFGPIGLPVLTSFCYAPSRPHVEYGPEVMYTTLPQDFSTMNLQEGRDASWYMDIEATSHLASDSGKLTTVFNKSIIQSILVGDGSSIPVTNLGHSTLRSSTRPLHLYNVLITPNIIKNLVFVREFTKDNKCSIKFDEFGFFVKDYQTCPLFIRCDSTEDLYPFHPTTTEATTLIFIS
uniref:Ribonuclease H-like domain-containing protein n=1 Tax=Tanacetum cinerariifolium TaxID=118510 RepID=A0A6L2KUV1_TANCI|nr:ribonuclease H-like domain-containing protein [Tanacetum cinerariifolium]